MFIVCFELNDFEMECFSNIYDYIKTLRPTQGNELTILIKFSNGSSIAFCTLQAKRAVVPVAPNAFVE